MSRYFEFDPEKALAVSAFLANESGETMYTILKMVYIADCLHLERYGRPITGDDFFALPEGACPTKIYDSMKALRGEASTNYMPESEEYLQVDPMTHDVDVKKPPLMDALSPSDTECLRETISILKSRGRWHIRDLAHDSVWKNASRNSKMDFISIAKSRQDGETLAQHLEAKF